MSEKKPDPGVQAAEQARAELYDTLGRLRGQLDYAQRIDDATARAKQRCRAVRKEQPLLFAAGVAAVAAAVGLAAWGVARFVSRGR